MFVFICLHSRFTVQIRKIVAICRNHRSREDHESAFTTKKHGKLRKQIPQTNCCITHNFAFCFAVHDFQPLGPLFLSFFGGSVLRCTKISFQLDSLTSFGLSTCSCRMPFAIVGNAALLNVASMTQSNHFDLKRAILIGGGWLKLGTSCLGSAQRASSSLLGWKIHENTV